LKKSLRTRGKQWQKKTGAYKRKGTTACSGRKMDKK